MELQLTQTKSAAPLHHVVAQLSPGMKKGKTPRKPLASAWTAECKECTSLCTSVDLCGFPVAICVGDRCKPCKSGAVLSQEHGGKLRPIAYASRVLRSAEKNMQNYSSMKLEFLALSGQCQKSYLLGGSSTVYTDDNPLRHLDTAKLGAVE